MSLIPAPLEEFVAAGDFLAYKFGMWSWFVLVAATIDLPNPSSSREKGDSSKARDYLPADKQYLVTRGVPCLRRATSLAYTDADEDAERLLNFGDSSGGDDGDEWVETHSGRKPNLDSAANPGEIADIPDDSAQEEELSLGVGDISLNASDIPDMDDIPDMEEDDLEEGDEATAAPKANVIDARSVIVHLFLAVLSYNIAKSKSRPETSFKFELTML